VDTAAGMADAAAGIVAMASAMAGTASAMAALASSGRASGVHLAVLELVLGAVLGAV